MVDNELISEIILLRKDDIRTGVCREGIPPWGLYQKKKIQRKKYENAH